LGDRESLNYGKRDETLTASQVECQTAQSENKVFVFEEIVPLQYQNELVNPPARKKRIFRRFPRHSEPSTLPTARETEFDARLKRHSTKVITLSKPIVVGEIGSPMPASPQTHRSSGDTAQMPMDQSPLAGRGKHASTNFMERLNAAAPRVARKGDVQVMRVHTGEMRVPVRGLGQSDADRWLGESY
jgi:hypothetical protein